MWKNLPNNNSKVTVELRELIENGVNIWDFEYPSYYEGDAKRAFEQKVIDHYLFRQIGQETPARWLHYFRTRMREIMPYYIQLYHSVELMESVEDPFEAYNLTETYEEERTGSGKVNTTASSSGSSESSSTNTGTSEASSERSGTLNKSTVTDEDGTTDNIRKFSNTPQGSLANLDNYLTEATIETGSNTHDATVTENGTNSETVTDGRSSTDTVTSESSESTENTNESTSEDSGTTKYTMTRKGNIGVQPLGAEVRALRDAFINVDMMVIDELRDLFLMVY